jgi:hypothetical protein
LQTGKQAASSFLFQNIVSILRFLFKFSSQKYPVGFSLLGMAVGVSVGRNAEKIVRFSADTCRADNHNGFGPVLRKPHRHPVILAIPASKLSRNGSTFLGHSGNRSFECNPVNRFFAGAKRQVLRGFFIILTLTCRSFAHETGTNEGAFHSTSESNTGHIDKLVQANHFGKHEPFFGIGPGSLFPHPFL